MINKPHHLKEDIVIILEWRCWKDKEEIIQINRIIRILIRDLKGSRMKVPLSSTIIGISGKEKKDNKAKAKNKTHN